MPLELIPLLFAVAGAFFVVVGVRGRRAARAFEQRAEETYGFVTEVRWRTVGRRPPRQLLAFPVLSFTTRDGRPVEAEAAFGTQPPRAKEGDQVTVLYDPADPTRPRLSGTGTEKTLYGLFVGLGGLFVVLGVLGFAGLQALPDDLLDGSG